MDTMFPTITSFPMWACISVGVIVVILALGFIVLGNMSRESKKFERGMTSLIIAVWATVALTAGGLVWIYNIGTANDKSREEAVKSQIFWVVSHGVTPDVNGFKDLNFPDVKPTEDTEFGIAQVVKDKKIISIHLAWENDEFVLYGTDGEPLKQIK